MKKKLFLFGLIALLMSSATLTAQVTVGSSTVPHEDALLDLVEMPADSSSTKGLLLPRVKLVSTADAAPMENHVNGMLVYNTATTAGVNAVTPGTYYNDGKKWVRAVTPDTEPWCVTGTTNQATGNTQNIYQMGQVTVGSNTGQNGAGIRLVATPDNGVANDFSVNNYTADVPSFVFRSYGVGAEGNTGNILGNRPLFNIVGYGTVDGQQQSLSAISARYAGNGSNNSSNLNFSTSGTLKMVIDPLGNVGIGATAPRTKLEVNGAITNTFFSISGTGSNVVDFSKSNFAQCTATGNTFVLQNIVANGTYILLHSNLSTMGSFTLPQGARSQYHVDRSPGINGERIYTIHAIGGLLIIISEVITWKVTQ